MPATKFICRDGKTINIQDCLQKNGCRMHDRCAPIPYLRAVSYDRGYYGVTPSAAGNGPRLIWLKAVFPYPINPDSRAFAMHGTAVHGKLSMHAYTKNVISEEPLSDELIQGIPDLLEEDEQQPGKYILTDYKTFGSYKVAVKCFGIQKKSFDEPVLDDNGEPIIYKSGKREGEVRTRKVYSMEYDKSLIDLRSETLQLNRYRILFEQQGFDIHKLKLFCIVRDGGTHIAEQRGLEHNTYTVDIPILQNSEGLGYYNKLSSEVNQAFTDKWARMCNEWESWDGRRCSKYCEVYEHCQAMQVYSKEKNWIKYYEQHAIGEYK